MPSNITCSTEPLTLAIAPFLFILVDVKFTEICYGTRCVHFIVSSGRRGTLFFQGAHMYIQIQHQIYQKDLNLCLTSYDNAKVSDKLEKTQTRNSAVSWSL